MYILHMICCSGFALIFLSNRCSRECGEQLYWCTWSDWSGFAACTQAGKLIKPWIGGWPGFLSLLKTLNSYACLKLVKPFPLLTARLVVWAFTSASACCK